MVWLKYDRLGIFAMAADSLVVRKMAQLIRAGATLTSYTCPACGTPLLKLKTGEHYCARCEKQVVIVKTEEEERTVAVRYRLQEVRDTIVDKLIELNDRLRKVTDVSEAAEVLRTMLLALDVYSRIDEIIEGRGQKGGKG